MGLETTHPCRKEFRSMPAPRRVNVWVGSLEIESPCRSPLPALVENLNGVNAGVVLDRDKRKHQLALSVRLERVKHFVERTVFAAGFLENVEIAQQRCAVHVDVKNAVTCAPSRGFPGAEPGFAEEQSGCVLARSNRYRVDEISVALTHVEFRIGRSLYCLGARHPLAPDKMAVRAPRLAVFCVDRGVTRHNSYWMEPAGNARKNLDGVQKRVFLDRPRKRQVQESIRGGRDVLVYFNIRGVRAGRVCDYVQTRNQRFPVRQDVEQPIGFTAPRDIAVTEESFRKVEVQLVDPRLKRYVVAEDTLPA